MKNKKGFASVFFLVWFLLISQIVVIRLDQINTETEMHHQITRIEEQEEELLPLLRWTRFQLSQQVQCEGWIEMLQREAVWDQDQVYLRGNEDVWIIGWDKDSRQVMSAQLCKRE